MIGSTVKLSPQGLKQYQAVISLASGVEWFTLAEVKKIANMFLSIRNRERGLGYRDRQCTKLDTMIDRVRGKR